MDKPIQDSLRKSTQDHIDRLESEAIIMADALDYIMHNWPEIFEYRHGAPHIKQTKGLIKWHKHK